MKTTGIVRRTDNLGRIVVPKEWRNMLNIGCGDPVEMLVEGDSVIIRKYQNAGAIKQHMHEPENAVNQSHIKFDTKSAIMAHLRNLNELLEGTELTDPEASNG